MRSKFSRDERLTSLNDDLAKAGKVPGTRLLEFRSVDLTPGSVEAIDADLADTELVMARRLRLADGMPLAILTNYLPRRYGITAEDLQQRGLYDCLRALGVNLKIAQQRINARLLTDDEATLLEEELPAACLTAERVAYDDTGAFVEFGRHVYRSAHYSIQSSLVV